MRIVSTLLKLIGSLVIAFVGYFIMAAVGWPEPLESMTLERNFVGGAFILLGALCALASVLPPRRKPRSAMAAMFDESPVEHTPAREPAPVVAAPEPLVQDLSRPEPEPEPAVASLPVLVEETPPVAHPASLSEARDLLAKGDQQFAEGHMDDALEHYTAALAKARALHAAAPGDDTQDLLACALKAVGDANDETARLDAATTAYEEALGIRTDRLQADPADPQRKRAVSLILERLGDVRAARGHVSRALDLYRQSLPIAQSLADAEPDNRVYQVDLATTKERLAELESRPQV